MKGPAKYLPTKNDITAVLQGAVRPSTAGDITYDIAAKRTDASPSTVEEARGHLNLYRLNLLLGELVADGTIVARTGREWKIGRVRSARNHKRQMSTTYYALPVTVALWDIEDRVEDSQRLNSKARTRAAAAVIAAHQNEYSRHYQAVMAQLTAEAKQ